MTVRDDGRGIPEGRLAEAEAAGHLGVACSMRGRVEELGGTITLHTAEGEGTEWEITVPRAAGAVGAAGAGEQPDDGRDPRRLPIGVPFRVRVPSRSGARETG